MKPMKSRLIFPLAVILCAPLVTANAGDLEAGRAKAEIFCQTCHGMDGQATTDMVAHISGQQKEYLIIQLQAYRSGKRQHEQMSIIAGSLSDDDIENLAEWYSSIEVTVKIPDYEN